MTEIKKYFCFDLYTAGIVIGWLGFGGALVGTVGYSYAFINIDLLMENTTFAALPHLDEFDSQYSEEFLRELKFCKILFGFFFIGLHNSYRIYHFILDTCFLLVTSIACNFVEMIAAMCLVIGTIKVPNIFLSNLCFIR